MYLRSVPILQTNMPTQRRKSSKYNLTLHLLMRYKKVTCQFLWKLLFKIVDTASLSRVSEQASGNFKSFISLYKNGYLSKQNLKFLVKITLPYWVEDKKKIDYIDYMLNKLTPVGIKVFVPTTLPWACIRGCGNDPLG